MFLPERSRSIARVAADAEVIQLVDSRTQVLPHTKGEVARSRRPQPRVHNLGAVGMPLHSSTIDYRSVSS
jgi:hypothetical protein